MTKGHQVGASLARGLHKALGGHVHTQVDDLKAGALEHHRHQVLADVVQIAAHGPHEHLADGFGSARGEQRPDQLERAFHGACGYQKLRHEILVLLEKPADFVHGRDHVIVQERLGVRVLGEGALDK